MATTYGTLDAAGSPAARPVAAAPAAAVVSGAVADPAPLGLAAFGITTLVLSVVNAGWLGSDVDKVGVLSLAVPFGGIAQFAAGMWAFKRGNTFAATAFTSYAAFWLSFFLLIQFFAAPVAAAGGVGSVNAFVGMYLFSWGIFTLYMFVASLGSVRAVQLVFVLLTATFFFLAFGTWQNSTTTTHIGGYLGVATAVAALYASFADVLNATWGRVILPTDY